MPLIETRGAGSAQGFGEFAQSAAPVYIEDVFSTYLYTGNGSTQTITNGIDLSGKGGLVWLKERQPNGFPHRLQDSARGVQYFLDSASTAAEAIGSPQIVSSFNSNGFSLNANNLVNGNGNTEVSWTFRKQAKFFDIVTYTGNGSNRTIAHNLGSVPGCILVKRTDTTGAWAVYHRSLANTEYIVLNTTAAKATGTTYWNSTTPTSTEFSLGTAADVNANSGTYVAYLFAHDAGGFGLSGSDNVISCGSYTGNDSSEVVVNLGYEPQWLLIKRATDANDPYRGWTIFDNMRGMAVTGNTASLIPNSSDAENSIYANARFLYPTATGFNLLPGLNRTSTGGNTYIYIAIRRGPMKVPTSGTSVFEPIARTGTGAAATVSSSLSYADLAIVRDRTATTRENKFTDRLRGGTLALASDSTSSEGTDSGGVTFDVQNAIKLGTGASYNTNGTTYINYLLRRAPGFFDIVCFTATGSNFSVTHNLGAVPELVITKERNGSRSWYTYAAGAGNTKYLALDGTAAATTGNAWQDTTPTSTTLYLTGGSSFFSMSQTYVAYLFATLAGVSKVGTYTGTGTTKQIDCGFTGGARFVVIKRTDSTGDWYYYDSARGIVAGNDPYLFFNSKAAEVTSTDYVDTYSAGFELSSTAPAALNANGGTYIFLAIA